MMSRSYTLLPTPHVASDDQTTCYIVSRQPPGTILIIIIRPSDSTSPSPSPTLLPVGRQGFSTQHMLCYQANIPDSQSTDHMMLTKVTMMLTEMAREACRWDRKNIQTGDVAVRCLQHQASSWLQSNIGHMGEVQNNCSAICSMVCYSFAAVGPPETRWQCQLCYTFDVDLSWLLSASVFFFDDPKPSSNADRGQIRNVQSHPVNQERNR